MSEYRAVATRLRGKSTGMGPGGALAAPAATHQASYLRTARYYNSVVLAGRYKLLSHKRFAGVLGFVSQLYCPNAPALLIVVFRSSVLISSYEFCQIMVSARNCYVVDRKALIARSDAILELTKRNFVSLTSRRLSGEWGVACRHEGVFFQRLADALWWRPGCPAGGPVMWLMVGAELES